jgi:TRAP-type C4-dicarboxylate transport system substrate-binding protein
MKKLSFLFCITIIAVLTLSLCVACTGEPTEPTEPTQPTEPTEPEQPTDQIVLRLTMAQPPMDPIAEQTMLVAEKFNERANGSYVIEVYPAEQLAKYAETMDAVRTGAIEMANIGWGGFANNWITLTAAEMPFLYDSIEANAEVVASLPDILDEGFQANLNVKPLACHHVETIEIIGNKSIQTLDDWKGVKIAGATYYGPEFAKVIGAAPVFVAYPEFYSSLEKGVVDAVFDSPTFTIMGKVYEVIDYQTVCQALGSSHGFLINLDIWNDMPEDIQSILMEESKAGAAAISDIMVDMYYAHLEEAANNGVEQFFISKEERDKWAEHCSSFLAEQEEIMGPTFEQIKQAADAANAKYPYQY